MIGVDLDDEGHRRRRLRDAVARGDPSAVFLQPRAHNPTGVTTDAGRAQGARRGCSPTPTRVVVEDDHAGDIATGAAGQPRRRACRQRTVHIRSYSKSHGPDLRLAAVGGAGDVVTAVANRRLLGPGLVQPHPAGRAASSCSTTTRRSPTVADRARVEYARRRRLRRRRARRRGVAVTGTDGINLWMAVADERSALVTLAAQGIGVAPGEPFLVRPDATHLRVTVGLIEHDHERVADQLAAAAGGLTIAAWAPVGRAGDGHPCMAVPRGHAATAATRSRRRGRLAAAVAMPVGVARPVGERDPGDDGRGSHLDASLRGPRTDGADLRDGGARRGRPCRDQGLSRVRAAETGPLSRTHHAQ